LHRLPRLRQQLLTERAIGRRLLEDGLEVLSLFRSGVKQVHNASIERFESGTRMSTFRTSRTAGKGNAHATSPR
jgi:hypothetical protein